MFRRLLWRSLAARAGHSAKTTAKYQSTSSANSFRSGSLLNEPVSAVGYGMLVIPLTTFALGCWQVQRRKWKLGLIEDLEQRICVEPISLPEDLRELDKLEYRRIRVRGHFVHEDELYIGPRCELRSHNAGFMVVTPFKLEDRDLTILVNRGWVPRAKTNPATRRSGQQAGIIDLIGIVRKTEKRPPLGSPEGRDGPLFVYRNVDEMAYMVNAAPVFLDAIRETSVEGGPIGGQTSVQLRNEHTSYIATWYTLSACTAYMWYTRYGRLLKK